MSKTSIRFAELHAPLFSRADGQHGQGTNLGMKLDPHARAGLVLEFDEESKHLYVTFNEVTCRVPETNIVTMIEGQVKSREHVQPAPVTPMTAQVDSPQSHVFAGPGKGKTSKG